VPAKSSTAPNPSDLELVITRTIHAPRELVFDAWTKPEHLEQWQGAPAGFTVTEHQVDLRPGGSFRLCMRSADGVDHRLQGEYREVVPPEKLVFSHSWLDRTGRPTKETLVTLTFVARGNKTELTLKQTGYPSVQARDGHNGGWNSTFDRFTDYLASL
jgi:uncharacterized protein YndB with AHSA1/START domain